MRYRVDTAGFKALRPVKKFLMRMPTRELIALSILTLVVAAVTSGIHVIRLADRAVRGTQAQVRAVNQQVLAILGRVVKAHDPVAGNGAIEDLLDASLAHTPGLLTLSIADANGQILLSSRRDLAGRIEERHAPLDQLVTTGSFQRMATLMRNGKVYEERLLVIDGDSAETFGAIVGGVDTSLIRDEVRGALRASLNATLLGLPVAWLLAFAVASATRRGVRRLSLRIDQLRHGELEDQADLGLGINFQELGLQLGLLAGEMRSERLSLMARTATLQSIMDHMQDAVLLLDPELQIVFYNQACEAILGRPLAATTGEPLDAVLSPAHPLVRAARSLVVDGTDYEDVPCTLPTSERFRDSLLSAHRLDHGADLAAMLLLLEDLGSLRTLQRLVDYSARMAAMSRVTADVVHDVKNPLHAMNLNLMVLEHGLPQESTEMRETIHAIKRQITSLDRTVRGFLDYVRPRDIDESADVLSVHGLLGELASFIGEAARQQGVEVCLEPDPDPADPRVRGDIFELRRALLNVLQNGLEAMPDGGRLTLRTQVEADLVRVTVCDQGPGISAELLERVFDYRYTTKPDGSGIGLSVVRRIIEAHGGRVSMQSAPGAGATVSVELPLLTPAGNPPESEP